MDAKTIIFGLIMLVGAASSNLFATVSTNGLEEYDFDEMTLLKVVPGDGKAASACFYARHRDEPAGRYVWVHPVESIGKPKWNVTKVLDDRIYIEGTQSVNSGEWIEIDVYWPVADERIAKPLVDGCGRKQDR